ncbi:MAG: UbiA family prenyltransferase [Euryarchaeota archaeon]|nr:UbiA family prenyltransferase [Euryarchaeota archaeon]
MNKYLRLFRLGNGVMGVFGLLIGAFISVGLDIAEHAQDLAIASVLVLIFIAGGNSLNDYVDRELDKIGHPDRPLPRGEIPPRRALHLASAASSSPVSCPSSSDPRQ